MKKIITTSLIALLVGFTATAQSKKVAIFDPAGSVDKNIKEIVREEISSIIVNAGGYTVLERSLINKVLEESKFQQSGLVEDSQVSEMGKRMGANIVFVSSVTRMSSSSYYVSCKVIDVQTARIEMQRTAQTQQGVSDLLQAVQRMVRLMFKPALLTTKLTATGRRVYAGDIMLPKDEVRLTMNTQALQLYNKGILRRKIGNAFLITYGTGVVASAVIYGRVVSDDDGFLFGCAVGAASAAMFGSPLLVTGVTLKLNGNSNIRKSVNTYNNGGKTSNAELKFGFTGNGVGLALNF